ncbi:MAG TPA: hypothetical protein VLG48_05785 [Candidatus Methylomirabilis sp.]|nr:hypothetical protein [Candidatus Methylomirabilis sp.]
MISRLVTSLALCILSTLVLCPVVKAEPVLVRFTEGVSRGFLTLRSANGEKLADGELLQMLRPSGLESRLVFRFTDGSLHDETVLYSQRRIFALLHYRLIQRGASFPLALDVSFDRKRGRYEVRSQNGTGPEKTLSGQLSLPPDVYNGMTSTLLKNLRFGASETVHLVAFTPEPRLVKVHLTPVGEEAVRVGDAYLMATRYQVKTDLKGFVGFLTSLLGMELPVLHYWIARGEVPAFVKFEGPFFMDGPIWRVGSSYHTDGPDDPPRLALTPGLSPQ